MGMYHSHLKERKTQGMDKSSAKLLLVGGGVSLVLAASMVLVMTRQTPLTSPLPSPQAVAAALSGTPALVATRSIDRGTVIRASDVPRLFTQVYEPSSAVLTATVFATPAQLTALLAVAPRRLTTAMLPGQQLTAPMLSGLATPLGGGAVAAALPTGFDGEAITITVPAKAVNDALAVNDRVDVIYTTVTKNTATAATQLVQTGMLVQGATIVAASPYSETYTLGLTPGDAVRVAHAQELGWSLRLAVRSVMATGELRNAPTVMTRELTH